jgi:hypothetical protein
VEDLPPTPPLGYLTVTREDWTILSNKVYGLKKWQRNRQSPSKD